VSSGIAKPFLRLERERAEAGETTEDCTFADCTGCGVCTSLGVDIALGAGSRG
jgi:hypothetical protein